MYNPYMAMMQMQMSLWQGWATGMSEAMKAYNSLFSHQMDLLKPTGYSRSLNILPRGADWNDHYGKRAHDVDVEHMR